MVALPFPLPNPDACFLAQSAGLVAHETSIELMSLLILPPISSLLCCVVDGSVLLVIVIKLGIEQGMVNALPVTRGTFKVPFAAMKS